MTFLSLSEWLKANATEVFGVISSLVYLYFSIKQKIWLWPLGILSSALYIVIFFQARLYADMGLNVYYVLVSIYGWYNWWRPSAANSSEHIHPQYVDARTWLQLSLATVLLFGFVLAALLLLPRWLGIPKADIPWLDATASTLSITATWMLARKYIEQWLVWVFVDLLSVSMYIYKQMLPTAALFGVYTVMAVIGFLAWKKDLNTLQTSKL